MTRNPYPALDLNIKKESKMTTKKVSDRRSGDEYGTPLDLYTELDRRFHFKLDPCTTLDNPLGTEYFYTMTAQWHSNCDYTNSSGPIDGLTAAWSPGPVFMNPPYSHPEPWARKAYEESLNGNLVVGLMRHDPSTKWWNLWIKGKALIIPVPYRIKFVGANGCYNFPNVIIIWTGLWTI